MSSHCVIRTAHSHLSDFFFFSQEDDVIEARVEVFRRWKDAFAFLPSKNGQGSTVVIDQETINEAIAGVKQFTFNMSDSPLAKA